MKNILLFLCFFCSMPLVVNANSLSGISVTPTRLILSDQKKSAAITLRNTSDSEISYRLKFIEMGFDGNGELIKLAASQQPVGFNSLSSYVRFSPRQVKLAAGASQVIRVMVLRNPNLDKGEYRSHLEIRVLPRAVDRAFLDIETAEEQEKVRPTVITSLGITMPVVWRNGDLDAGAVVSNVAFMKSADNTIRAISMDIERTGQRSVFGDIYVSIKDEKNKKTLLASYKDYGIYHPYEKESIVFPARSIHEGELKNGEIVVEFVNDESTVGPKILFNESVEWDAKVFQ